MKESLCVWNDVPMPVSFTHPPHFSFTIGIRRNRFDNAVIGGVCMKRLLVMLLLVSFGLGFVWPALRDKWSDRSSFFQSNQWTSIKDSIEHQLVPNLQQLFNQFPNTLQSLEPNHILEGLQGTNTTSKSVDPKDLLLVKAGDSNITEQKVQEIEQIVRSYSYPTLQKAISQPYQHPVEIWLYSTAPTYRQALQSSGVNSEQAGLMSQETGGIAQGNQILIPLYQTNTRPELVNILTHEMTHVALNQLGIGNTLPTWINEGLAWQEGLTAEQQVDPKRVAMEQMQMQQSIRQAYQRGELLSLSSDEQAILNAKYNVEAEDYLAVVYLEKQYGVNSFNQFLNALHNDSLPAWIPSQNSDSSTYRTFENVFHVSFETFEQKFMNSLNT
jgi:hypothetical protein